MISCPKCGSGNIVGPKYEHGKFSELLRYVCGRCGYQTTTATKDAKKFT